MRQRRIIALGGRLSVVVAAILVGRDRWRRALRELDRRSGGLSEALPPGRMMRPGGREVVVGCSEEVPVAGVVGSGG